MLLLAAACSRSAPREPLITHFDGDHGVSIRHPSSWRTEQAVQEGIWYRYFLAPPAGPERRPAVSVTLLVGALAGSIDEFAQRVYLAGHKVVAESEDARGAARGKSFLFQSSDGATRHSLLLLKDGERVYGLYAQGATEHFERHSEVLGEMAKSLTLEKAPLYPEHRNPRFAFAVRIPASWRETRQFSGGANLLLQFRSPALAADRDRDPVHASLTLTVEPIPDKGGIQEYYESTRNKLGDAFEILSHAEWRGGYADVMRTETPIAMSRVKRYYRASLGRGYSMTFEARDDVFVRVSRWCDLIAGTLQVGEELQAP